MLIGSLQVELHLPACHSLKEKRFTLQGLKTRLRNRFNVSVAEVDQLDNCSCATLAIAYVANERAQVERVLSRIEAAVARERHVVVESVLTEIV